MAAIVQIVPLALLHMCPVQRCPLSLGLCPQSPARAKLTVSQRALRWWRDPASHQEKADHGVGDSPPDLQTHPQQAGELYTKVRLSTDPGGMAGGLSISTCCS